MKWRTLLIHTQKQKTYLLFLIIQPITVPANILIVQAQSIPMEFGTLYTSHTWAKEIKIKISVVEYRASIIQGAMQFFSSDILYCHWPGSWPHCSLTLPWILEGLREILPVPYCTKFFPIHSTLQWASPLGKEQAAGTMESMSALILTGNLRVPNYLCCSGEGKIQEENENTSLNKVSYDILWLVSTSRKELPTPLEDTMVFHT